MDEQNRNLILATALSFVVILVWFVLFPPPEPPATGDGTTRTAVEAPADAAIQDDVCLAAYRRNNVRQRVDCGRRCVELAAAMIGNPDGVGSHVQAAARIFCTANALDGEWPAPDLLHPFGVFPGDRAIELGIQELDYPHATGIHLGPVGGSNLRRGQHVHQITRTGEYLADSLGIDLGRDGEGIDVIALAIAGHGNIDRQDNAGKTRGAGALQRLFDDGAVFPDIDLEPFRAVRQLCHALDCRRAERGQAIDQPGLPRGPGHGALSTLGVKEPLGGCGCHDDGGSTLCAHYLGAHVDFRDVDECLEVQLVVGITPGIVPQRHLIIRSAIDIVEYHARQSLARQLSQIADIMSRRYRPHGQKGRPRRGSGQARNSRPDGRGRTTPSQAGSAPSLRKTARRSWALRSWSGWSQRRGRR